MRGKNKAEPEKHCGLRGLSVGANFSAHLCSSSAPKTVENTEFYNHNHDPEPLKKLYFLY